MKTAVWFGFGLFGSLFGSLCAAAGQVTLTKPGRTVTLPCGVDTYKNSLEWKHGNELIFNIFMRGFPRKGGSDTARRSIVRTTRLRISNVKEIDAGRFTCIADGTVYDHTLLVVSMSTLAGPSDDFLLGSEVTLQCEVKGLNPEPAVQWLRPDGSPHTGSETVLLKPASDSGTWTCTFSHEGVTYSEDLHIKVKEPKPATPSPRPSHGPEDTSKPTWTTRTHCPGPPGDSEGPPNRPTNAGPLLGLSWWMWVMTGVGCLVLVLLTVSVICLCDRRRRRKLHDCQTNRPTAAAKPQQRRRREQPSAPPQRLLLE